MKQNMPKIPQQIISLVILFAVALIVFIIARILFIPDSFGVYGHYRADAVNEIIAQEINYAGYGICIECHDDIFMLKIKSNHKGVACEVCHGPAAKHVDEPDEYIPPAPRDREQCALCHGYNPSRPTGFPQIITELHNPGKACLSCHDPHNPIAPTTLQGCNACHREISRQKMVSHHSSLDCKKCHIVPDQHALSPNIARAEKPKSREFCGQCHSIDADSPREIPRINLLTHEARYLCWDCHYPHQPEVK